MVIDWLTFAGLVTLIVFYATLGYFCKDSGCYL